MSIAVKISLKQALKRAQCESWAPAHTGAGSREPDCILWKYIRASNIIRTAAQLPNCRSEHVSSDQFGVFVTTLSKYSLIFYQFQNLDDLRENPIAFTTYIPCRLV
jgi:hypothetical protein